MSKSTPKPSFLKRYMLTIVMIPSIIGIHYGWSLLQQNRSLVREDEQIELPVITFFKHGWHRLIELNSTQKDVTTPAVAAATK